MKHGNIAKDLGQDLQRRIGEVLDRQTRIAAHVLELPDLSIMLMEAAVSTVLTTAATIAAHSNDEERGMQFDRVIEAIAVLAARDRGRTLAAIEKQKAAGQ